MQYTIRHETRCHFDHPASYSIRNLRITPREEGGLRVTRWHVSAPARTTRSVDAWGNVTHSLTMTEPHEDVRIVVTGVIEVPDQASPLLGKDNSPLHPHTYLAETRLTSVSPAILDFAQTHFASSPLRADTLVAGLQSLLELLQAAPSSGQTLIGADGCLTRRSATLPDHVHVAIALFRSLGLPARFVSGHQLGRRPSEYAWADAWLEEEGGWVSFDVRRAQPASGRLVRLAVGRDYLDACPMRTAHNGGGHEEVRVSLQAA